jgi:uncharacterized protein (TIGR03083 family)
VVPGFLEEYANCAALLRGVDAEGWRSPTRCADWCVADVAGHVVGQLSDVVSLRLEGLGTEEVNTRQVQERRGRNALDLLAELEPAIDAAGNLANAFDDDAWGAPAPGDPSRSLGGAVLTLWFDTFVHLDDMAGALRGSAPGGRGLTGALSHVTDILTDRSWGPRTLKCGEVGLFEISGGGPSLACDPMDFVLAAAGRLDPSVLGLDSSVVILG